MGLPIIDADRISHDVIKEQEAAIISRWKARADERHITLEHNGILDRRALGNLLFSNKSFLEEHEAAIMPHIEKTISTKIITLHNRNKNKPVVLNAPTLHKTYFLSACQFVLWMKSPFLVRFIRIKKRDILAWNKILQRFSAQREFFTQYLKNNADIIVVSNCGTRRMLEKKLKHLLTAKGFEV